MKQSIINKLEVLADRSEELEVLLSSSETINNASLFTKYAKENAQLSEIVSLFTSWKNAHSEIEDAKELLSDLSMQDIAKEEIEELKANISSYEKDLMILLLPKDPNDEHNAFLEIRAGTGGDEAAIFAGDLFRMYSKYAEKKNWKIEVLSSNPNAQGGFKEIISLISGQNVYSEVKFESGGHRVQRVPKTESQGRVHTSACTVAVMPELAVEDTPEINPSDLRIDTFRSSGAGGQHVNTTDSAIRITHIPTGIVVECQDERSQHKNKAKALSVLASRISKLEEEKRNAETSSMRKSLLGSGDRSDKIRTYNYPQGRITDHRINLTIYQLEEIMNGKLEDLIRPIMNEYQVEQLVNLESE
ncbi:MAG: peptide chain release factor 1 [Psittacicella sp.]